MRLTPGKSPVRLPPPFDPAGGNRFDVNDKEPGDVFLQMAGKALDIWQQYTDLYAKLNCRPGDWKTLENHDVYKWLAITFAMGQVNKPNVKEYWKTDPPSEHLPWFSENEMSQHRWATIFRNSHFVDNRIEDSPGHRGDRESPNYTPINRIVDWLEALNKGFRWVRYPATGRLAVDEEIIKMKGR